MPNRIIWERSRTSPTLNVLTDFAERLFWRLMTVADDYGRFEANSKIVLATCFPLKIGDLSPEQVATALDELVTAGLVCVYEAQEKVFGEFLTWGKHQRRRAHVSKFPGPPSSAVNGHHPAADVGGAPTDAPEESRSEESVDEDTRKRDRDHWPSPESLMELWNTKAPSECPRVRGLTAGRRTTANAALRQRPDLAFWEGVMAEMQQAPLLRGLKRSAEHPNWKADFDWLLGKKGGVENYVKVAEGRYRDTGAQKPYFGPEIPQR